MRAAAEHARSHEQYPLVALRRPIRAFIHVTLIAATGVLLTVIVPGYFAYRDGVLTRAQLEEKIRVKFADNETSRQFSPAMRALWKRYECERNAFFAFANCASDREALKDKMRGESAPTPPVTLIPFLSSPSLWQDPASLTCLGCLILLVGPIGSTVFRRGGRWWAYTIALAFWLYCFKDLPQWLRNLRFNTTDHGRMVFAYPNLDIDMRSFAIQELIGFLWAFLLAVLWRQWASSLDEQHVLLQSRSGEAIDLAFNTSRIRGLSDAYVHWQVASFLLAIPFFLTTLFYWPIVFQHHDFRYIPSALIGHFLWAASWVFISLPLAVDWHDWSKHRSAATAALRNHPDDLNALKELQPVSLVNLVGTGIGAVVGFVFPLLNALRS
jgi:hypothetical protein